MGDEATVGLKMAVYHCEMLHYFLVGKHLSHQQEIYR